MRKSELTLILINVCLGFIGQSQSFPSIIVSGVKCVNLDQTFVTTNQCFTKRVSKAVSETTVNVTLLQVTRSAAIRLEFSKKSNNQYNSYLFKSTLFDACKFMEKRSSTPIANYFYKMIENYTNINHTCPYRDHMIIDRFQFDLKKASLLPIPTGEYCLSTRWFAHGKPRFLVSAYITYDEN